MNGQDVEEQHNERATGWLYGFGNDESFFKTTTTTTTTKVKGNNIK